MADPVRMFYTKDTIDEAACERNLPVLLCALKLNWKVIKQVQCIDRTWVFIREALRQDKGALEFVPKNSPFMKDAEKLYNLLYGE